MMYNDSVMRKEIVLKTLYWLFAWVIVPGKLIFVEPGIFSFIKSLSAWLAGDIPLVSSFFRFWWVILKSLVITALSAGLFFGLIYGIFWLICLILSPFGYLVEFFQ